MDQNQDVDQTDAAAVKEMLSGSGYSIKAIDYYIKKPHLGFLADPDHVSEMTGTCGDTMKIFLKVDQGIIVDAKYQVLGCPGAVTAAMAAVDLIKGKSLEYAKSINDGDIFKLLEEIPAKKHHCIQLAVKILNKALDEYQSGRGSTGTMESTCTGCAPQDCCKKDLL
jgi:nitrogen fixation NifU-like protein